MTTETPFVHTDGRVFTYRGDVAHTTRDKRDITLKEWETNCTHPGCGERLIVRTATPTPWEWPRFSPAQFCEAHRAVARKAAQTKLVKARTDGLSRWRASPEGKAALEQRARDCMGSVEQMLYDTVRDLALADEKVAWSDVHRLVVAKMEPPAEGMRDTRHQRVLRALYNLQWNKKRLAYRSGVVTLLR